MKQLYFIALVLPEPYLSEISRIKHDLSKKYKTYSALKSPAHITLISPFFYAGDKEYELVKRLKDYASPVSPFTIEMNGFDCFPPRVVFIKPEPPAELALLYPSFNAYMKGFLPVSKKFSPPFHPHITVANRDWSAFDFEKAWEEYKTREYRGKFTADTISLLKLKNKTWEILFEKKL